MSESMRDNSNELKNAQDTIRALETANAVENDEQMTYELGQLLRQAAIHQMPESNSDLRNLLSEKSGNESTVVQNDQVEKLSITDQYTRGSRWRLLVLAASVFGASALAYVLMGFYNQLPVAGNSDNSSWMHPKVESSNQVVGKDDSASENSTSNAIEESVEDNKPPKVVYREEVRTRTVPNTRMRAETRTRSVPVTRMRTEIRHKKLADGTNETSKVEVPYPENVQQNYTVNVPYTENTTQSYSVQVPYTADGKLIAAADYKRYGVDVSRVKPSAPPQVVAANPGNNSVMGGAVFSGPEILGARVGGAAGFNGDVALREFSYESGRYLNTDRDGVAVPAEKKELSGGEQYLPIRENRFQSTHGKSAVSTFSIDVDTASYSNMRRFLTSGQRPPVHSIRVEELINYFDYNYPQPKDDVPFSVNMEMARCPWNDAHQLLRVGLKGKEVEPEDRPATNVVYLIDVSGSMQSPDKLPLLKQGFQMLTRQLNENDRVSIVTYAGEAGVALEPTTGDQTKAINESIERLTSGGSTHGSAGIELAYKLAQSNFIQDGVNKVILATDGDLNVGVTGDDALVKLIKQKASEDVFLTVLGFGTGNIKDGKLEQLADNGNGHYAYIDNTREAHRVLVEQMSGSLVTIAKDVKIQIEFNPAEVKSYRLIGYENRVLATKDFDDDRKDAGEIGAGHTVTAIYEIQTAGSDSELLSIPNGMKYQQALPEDEVDEDKTSSDSRLSKAAESGELATLALRFKKPDAKKSQRIEFTVQNEDRSFGSASDDFRFAASVAGFGMLLRGSEHAGEANAEMLLGIASESLGDDNSGYRSEFVDLIRCAMSIR